MGEFCSRFIPTCVGNMKSRRAAEMNSARFIPTCVGNMPAMRRSPAQWTVHPHVCGEHAPAATRRGDAARFIPTCVGNIAANDAVGAAPTVHPHVCGEHMSQYERDLPDRGSSPRVWGTCRRSGRSCCWIRFIPTCVGNMSSPSTKRSA